MSSPLRVLFEDNHCLAVQKPPGVLTVGDRTGDVSLLEQARDYLARKYDKPGKVFLGVVHRLDRPVGGVVLFARTSKAAGRLAEQFRGRSVQKTYEALVEGRMQPRKGTLVDRLVKDRVNNIVRIAAPGEADARESALDFEIIESLGRTTLLQIRPRTGRSHQIRVQLSAAGHPIAGDRKYGSKRSFAEGIALRAVRLVFEHPVTKAQITLEAPMAWSLARES